MLKKYGFLVLLFAVLFANIELKAQGPTSATLTLTTQPKHVVNCIGSTGNILSVQGSVTFTASTWDIYYQWFKETPDGFMPVSNAVINGSSLTFPAMTYDMAGAYYCQFWAQDRFDMMNFTNVITSETRIVDVLQNTVITENPMMTYANVGDIVHLNVKAHVYGVYGNNPTYKPTYQWYRDTVRKVAPIGKVDTVMLADNNWLAGAKSSILSITVDNANRLGNYWCTVSGQCGSASSAKAAVSAPPTITIGTQPANVTVCSGSDATFSAMGTASNSSTVTYQWWANGAKLMDQLNPKIAGATTNTLVLATGNATYSNIQCSMMTIDGLASATSNTASLTVNNAPMITTQPSSTISVQAGKPLTIEIGVTSDASNTFVWMNGTTTLTGQTSATLSIASATTSDAGEYTCVITNPCGTATSNSTTVTINLVGEATNVEEDINSLGLTNVNPNPTSDIANVSFNLVNSANVKLTVTDVYGNVVANLFEGFANSGLRNFSFSAKDMNLANGVYFVTLSTSGISQTKKISIVK